MNASTGSQWKKGKLTKIWSPQFFVRRGGKDSKKVTFSVTTFSVWLLCILVLVYTFS